MAPSLAAPAALAGAMLAPVPAAAASQACGADMVPGWMSIATYNPRGSSRRACTRSASMSPGSTWTGRPMRAPSTASSGSTPARRSRPGRSGSCPGEAVLRLTVPKMDADFIPVVAPDQNVEFALGFGWYQDDPVFGAISRQKVKPATSGTVQTVSWDGGPAADALRRRRGGVHVVAAAAAGRRGPRCAIVNGRFLIPSRGSASDTTRGVP